MLLFNENHNFSAVSTISWRGEGNLFSREKQSFLEAKFCMFARKARATWKQDWPICVEDTERCELHRASVQ